MPNLNNINDAAVPAFVILVILVVGLLAINRNRDRVIEALTWADGIGRHIRLCKDRVLEKWMERFPISANGLTTLRLFFVWDGLLAFGEGRYFTAALLNGIGWTTDLLDGAKARADARLHGKKSEYGGLYDVSIDLICFATYLVVLWPYYPPWLIISFSGVTALRIILYGIYHRGISCWGWDKRLPFSLPPATVAGQFKTVFVSISFLLVLMNPHSQINLIWATGLFGIATILEPFSLGEQCVRVWRYLRQPAATIPRP